MIGPTMTPQQALHIVQAALVRVSDNPDKGIDVLKQIAVEIETIKLERMAGIYKEDDAEIVTHDRYDEAIVEIERLKEALRDVVAHKPGTPGLHYDSIEVLLMNVIGQAEFALQPYTDASR